MKFTRYLALAAVLVVALFGLSVVTGVFASAADTAFADDTLTGSGVQLHKQGPADQQVTPADRTDSVLQLHKAWVRESVGRHVLNTERVAFEPIVSLDGHRNVLLKPKINIQFSGLGGNHYARAEL